MKSKITILSLFLLLNIIIKGQTWQWANKIGGTSNDYVLASTVDKFGNIYIVGNTESSFSIGSNSITNHGNLDMYLAKYDNAGTSLWIKSAGSSFVDERQSLSVDNVGNVYVVGKEIISTTDFDSIFKTLHEKVGQLMNADCFSVRIYHKERREIDYRYLMEKGERKTPLSVSMDDLDNYSVWCVTHNKEIFINDNLNEYHKFTKKIVVPSGEMPNSLLFCPLTIGDRVTGVITVQSFEKNAYTPFHMDVLKTLGTYTAIALENANLVETLEEKVNERTYEVVEQKEQLEKSFRNSKLLSEIGKEISATLSVDEIISTVYSQINTLMDATIFGSCGWQLLLKCRKLLQNFSECNFRLIQKR